MQGDDYGRVAMSGADGVMRKDAPGCACRLQEAELLSSAGAKELKGRYGLQSANLREGDRKVRGGHPSAPGCLAVASALPGIRRCQRSYLFETCSVLYRGVKVFLVFLSLN